AGPPAGAGPVRRLFTREGEHDLQAVPSFPVSPELIAIDDVLPRPCRVEQLRRHLVVVRGALTHHGHEGNDAGAAAYEEHGPAGIRIPDEVTADGTAQLEPVSRVRIPGQIRRNLAAVDPLDGQLDAWAAGRQPRRCARLRFGRLTAVSNAAPAVPADDVGERQIRRVAAVAENDQLLG